MKLTFYIVFNTRPGQDVFVNINDDIHIMNYDGDGKWDLTIEDNDGCYNEIRYSYLVREGYDTMYETGPARHSIIGKAELVEFHDQWQGLDDNAPFLTAPFTDLFTHHTESCLKYGKYAKEIILRVTAPNTYTDEQLYVCGNSQQLGYWNPDKALKMNFVGGARWEAQLKYEPSFEYKFIRKSKDSVEWESGENRVFEVSCRQTKCVYLKEHCTSSFAERHPRIAGTAIPVFSLRSHFGYGIGDFSNIKLLVDWAVKTGQKIIQLLPINDTTSTKTWTDSYPYSGISIMALHPLYLNLTGIGLPKDLKVRTRFEELRKKLNELPQIDYERVLQFKTEYTKIIFEETGAEVCKSADFQQFFKSNKEWLLPYAAFSYLRDKFGTADFNSWGEWDTYDEQAVEKLWKAKSSGNILKYHCFIQYYLDKQLKEARNYAHSKGVAIKGDIPIGITPHSVEAWKEPYYFNMDSQAGAPPDYFSEDGQNWGFPTYNWERMAQDGYLWWKKRFTKMAEYFDAYRIDHVLGFFRIWEIPQGYKSGKMGHLAPALPYSKDELLSRGMNLDLFLEDPHKPGYYHPRIDARGKGGHDMDMLYDDFFFHRHNEFWKTEAKKKLPALIAATNMLTCAEDLGMIPDCVPGVLSDLKVLTLEIQRMPKDPSAGLGNPNYFPYMCVCTTGSHDTSTLRGWWGETHNGEECSTDTCKWIVSEHLHSPAMLTIIPWQDWTSIDENIRAKDTTKERINNPANPHHYWQYRMHIDLEILNKKSDAFNAKVKDMISSSGR